MSAPIPPLPGADQPDENQGPRIAGAVISTTLAALVVVCARIFVRLRMIRSMGIDDYVMLAAMLLSLIGMGIVIAEVHYGAGRHAAYLDPEVNRFGLKLNFVSQPIYLWAIPMVKVSVGFFLIRISPSIFYKRVLQGVMIFLMAYTFVCFMTLVLQCKNLAILWDNRIQTTCWSQSTLQGLSYANSTVNIVTDLFFAILPIPMLWNVKINARTKASLICVLGLGIFACAAAIVKAAFISNYGKTGDFLWDSANLTIWIAAETNTGIIAACLPCIKPMFKTIFDSTLRYGSSRKKDAYDLRDYAHGTNHKGSKYLHSQTRTEVDARRGAVPNSLADNISEESILTQKGNGITKTTVVTIDRGVDDRGESSGWNKDYPERVVEDVL
uniref:Decarboxylase_GME4319 n=1 Tax=Daldinia eschscholzii IFB-TL01 TaxID=1169046 RepID=A0A0X9H1P0_9PEZI|nr:decarboxylase_GME4319 [Daldinia eschscholzii IFB-TL01]